MDKSFTLTALAFDTGLGLLAVQIFLWDADPWKVLMGFGAVYGWLAAFAITAFLARRRKRLLLLFAALPLVLEAFVSLVFSYPFHLIPAAVMVSAVALAQEEKPERTVASQTHP